jgi:hypothetical protein
LKFGKYFLSLVRHHFLIKCCAKCLYGTLLPSFSLKFFTFIAYSSHFQLDSLGHFPYSISADQDIFRIPYHQIRTFSVFRISRSWHFPFSISADQEIFWFPYQEIGTFSVLHTCRSGHFSIVFCLIVYFIFCTHNFRFPYALS